MLQTAEALNYVPQDVYGYRLQKVEERVTTLADREQVSGLRASMQERGRAIDEALTKKADQDDLVLVRGDVHDLAEEVRGLRKVLLGFAVAVGTGSISVSLTILATQHFHG